MAAHLDVSRLCTVVLIVVMTASACTGGSDDQKFAAPLEGRTRIAFDDSGNHDLGFVGLWEDGDTRKIGSRALYTSVTLAPDGQHVAAIAQVPSDLREELHLIDVTSGAETILSIAGSNGPAEWAPDSSSVAIVDAEVLLVSVGGDILARATVRPRPSGGAPSAGVVSGWSPDAAAYAFVTEGQVVIIDSRSGRVDEAALVSLIAGRGTPEPYLVVWNWDSPTSFIVGPGVSDGPPRETAPQFFMIERTLTLSGVQMLSSFTPLYPGTKHSLPDLLSISNAVTAEHGGVELLSFKPTVDGSAFLYQLEDSGTGDARVFVRDAKSGSTIEVQLDRPGYGSGSIDAYVGGQ